MADNSLFGVCNQIGWIGGGAMTRQIRVEIERLQYLVDIYGGNPERWPAAERAKMVLLVKTDEEAAACVSHAQALDRIVANAPRLGEARLASLTTQISVMAEKEGRWAGEDVDADSVRPAANPSRGHLDEARSSNNRPMTGIVFSSLLGARRGPIVSLGMLATSFAIGILAGTTVMSNSDLIWPAMQQDVAVAGAGDGLELQQLELGDESFDQIVEELL